MSDDQNQDGQPDGEKKEEGFFERAKEFGEEALDRVEGVFGVHHDHANPAHGEEGHAHDDFAEVQDAPTGDEHKMRPKPYTQDQLDQFHQEHLDNNVPGTTATDDHGVIGAAGTPADDDHQASVAAGAAAAAGAATLSQSSDDAGSKATDADADNAGTQAPASDVGGVDDESSVSPAADDASTSGQSADTSATGSDAAATGDSAGGQVDDTTAKGNESASGVDQGASTEQPASTADTGVVQGQTLQDPETASTGSPAAAGNSADGTAIQQHLADAPVSDEEQAKLDAAAAAKANGSGTQADGQ